MKMLFVCLSILFCSSSLTGGILLSNRDDVARALTPDRNFDSFGNITCEDEWARLDSLAVELQNSPDVRAYIIYYGGRHYRFYNKPHIRLPRRGEAEARAARIKPYLVNVRGINAERVTMINGGFREEWSADIYVLPPETQAVPPSPTLSVEEIKFRRGKVRRTEYGCGDLG